MAAASWHQPQTALASSKAFLAAEAISAGSPAHPAQHLNRRSLSTECRDIDVVDGTAVSDR
jgi:hypothetical protein